MTTSERFIVSFTGHRELTSAQRESFEVQAYDTLTELQATHGSALRVYSGMAAGVDQIAAWLCNDLGIMWGACIPHPKYPLVYFHDMQRWNALLETAAVVHYCHEERETWNPKMNFDRNRQMVDWSDLIIAGTYLNVAEITPENRPRGGTAHAIAYVKAREKPLRICRLV